MNNTDTPRGARATPRHQGLVDCANGRHSWRHDEDDDTHYRCACCGLEDEE